MSAELILVKLENTNLKDRIELLEKQLATANAELASKMSGAPTADERATRFDPNNLTTGEKKAMLIGAAAARSLVRRVWKVAERVRAVHPEWTYDMHRGKLYIVFGNTDMYGPFMPNTYGVKVSCKSTFTVYPTLGYLKAKDMAKHDDVAKSDVLEKIESMVGVWTERLASENMELTGSERRTKLVGKRSISGLSALAELLRERGIDVVDLTPK